MMSYQIRYRAIDHQNIDRVNAINEAYHRWRIAKRPGPGTRYRLGQLAEAGFLDAKWLSGELPDRFAVSRFVLRDPNGIICAYRPLLVRRTRSGFVPDFWDEDFRQEMKDQDPNYYPVPDVFGGWGKGEQFL